MQDCRISLLKHWSYCGLGQSHRYMQDKNLVRAVPTICERIGHQFVEYWFHQCFVQYIEPSLIRSTVFDHIRLLQMTNYFTLNSCQQIKWLKSSSCDSPQLPIWQYSSKLCSNFSNINWFDVRFIRPNCSHWICGSVVLYNDDNACNNVQETKIHT